MQCHCIFQPYYEELQKTTNKKEIAKLAEISANHHNTELKQILTRNFVEYLTAPTVDLTITTTTTAPIEFKESCLETFAEDFRSNMCDLIKTRAFDAPNCVLQTSAWKFADLGKLRAPPIKKSKKEKKPVLDGNIAHF
jgi:hypothetical protein